MSTKNIIAHFVYYKIEIQNYILQFGGNFMEMAIVYFSRDNNTRTGARILGEKIGAKVIELTEIKKGNFIKALFKMESKLKGNPWKEIKSSKRIYLMSPIWASNGVPAMNTFINNSDFSDKEIIIITFQQFKDLRGSKKVHEYMSNQVEKINGKVIGCYALLGASIGKCFSESEIKTQIDKIDI